MAPVVRKALVRVAAFSFLAVAAGCVSEPGRGAGARRAPLSTTEAAGPLRALIRSSGADIALRDGVILVKGAWGIAPGQFGARFEDGGIGPAAIALGEDGRLLVLDQVNRRVQEFDPSGVLARIVPLDNETAEDLIPAGNGLFVLVYEPGPDHGYSVVRYSPAGSRLAEIRLPRSVELVTGLFARGDPAEPDLWVEIQHGEQLLVAKRGAAVADRAEAYGRLVRGRGETRVLARRISSREAAVEHVYPGRFTSTALSIETVDPLIAITDPHVDAAGHVAACALLARPDPDDPARTGLRRVLVAAGPRGAVTVELEGEMVAESVRPIAYSRGGDLYQMAALEEGFVVRRFALAHALEGGAR
jgi:hypothetical protein